jgi:2-methylcitrate dehydratase PrpD
MLEMDDVHRSSILHPGPVIIPAAVAVAEQLGSCGRALLESIVRGYEATIRIGSALGTTHYRYFHNTSTAGAFGAATAAADLLGLDAEAQVWALANSGSRTGGLWQMRHESVETKPWHNVAAAQTGVAAAFAALAGVRGPTTLLEGPQGLFAAMAPGADARQVLSGPDGWRIHAMSFKPWPACRHAHPAIDAALTLRARLAERDQHAIANVTVATYQSALDFCDKPHPNTPAEAQFSLQHAVATALVHGPLRRVHFTENRLADAAVKALRDRVRCAMDPAHSAAFPAHYGATVTIELADGRRMTHPVPDAWGDPEWPLQVADIRNKAATLLQESGLADPAPLIAATQALPTCPDIREWTAMWP